LGFQISWDLDFHFAGSDLEILTDPVLEPDPVPFRILQGRVVEISILIWFGYRFNGFVGPILVLEYGSQIQIHGQENEVKKHVRIHNPA
jgi:hypothetical protein